MFVTKIARGSWEYDEREVTFSWFNGTQKAN